MLISRSGFRAFNEYDLRQTLENQLKEIKSKIEEDLRAHPPQDKFEYISSQSAEHQIKPIELKSDEIRITSSQQMIPTEYFPSGLFFMDEGKIQKEVLTFHLPFSGDPTLLRCVPSTRILWTEEIDVENGEILFDVINFNNEAETVKNAKNKVVEFLSSQANHVNGQVKQYNENLAKEIEEAVNQTVGKLSEHAQFLADLGTPLKSSEEEKLSESNPIPASNVVNKDPKIFDVFICHASEDKPYVSSLAEALRKAGMEVWYDEFQVGWGDDLRPTIDNGLKNSSFGIVVFSKSFLAKKKWTEYELNGLFAKEKQERKVILPVWHDITRDDMVEYSPSLADRIAKESSSVDEIVQELKTLLLK